MGAVAVANVMPMGSLGGYRAVSADVTFSSSYATGGDTVALSGLGLQNVYSVMTDGGQMTDTAQIPSKGRSPNTHGVQVVLGGSASAPKLTAYSGATSEVANATNLSTRGAVRVIFLGV